MCQESQTFLPGVMGPLGARKSSSSQNRCSALTQSDKLSSHPVYVTTALQRHYNYWEGHLTRTLPSLD